MALALDSTRSGHQFCDAQNQANRKAREPAPVACTTTALLALTDLGSDALAILGDAADELVVGGA